MLKNVHQLSQTKFFRSFLSHFLSIVQTSFNTIHVQVKANKALPDELWLQNNKDITVNEFDKGTEFMLWRFEVKTLFFKYSLPYLAWTRFLWASASELRADDTFFRVAVGWTLASSLTRFLTACLDLLSSYLPIVKDRNLNTPFTAVSGKSTTDNFTHDESFPKKMYLTKKEMKWLDMKTWNSMCWTTNCINPMCMTLQWQDPLHFCKFTMLIKFFFLGGGGRVKIWFYVKLKN